jgi:hypothetical protein
MWRAPANHVVDDVSITGAYVVDDVLITRTLHEVNGDLTIHSIRPIYQLAPFDTAPYEQAGLKMVPWDGMLKYYRPSPRMCDKRRAEIASSLAKLLPLREEDKTAPAPAAAGSPAGGGGSGEGIRQRAVEQE